MISFACPACNKHLKVKDELAGKRARCPACGKAISIPAASDLAAAGSTSNKPSPIPISGSPAREDRTIPPRPPSPPSEAPTIPPGDRPQGAVPADLSSETASEGARRDDSGHPPELTAFLAPPQAPDEIGRLGPYRVLAILGYGGMGVVFKAEDPHLERFVALKAMLPALAGSGSNRTRFLREAKAAAAVKDDHVVGIHQVGEDRGAPFLAMEFLEGQPLDQRIKEGPKLTVTEIVRIGRETALGLAAAHKRGLIHRDIKPGNLWLEGERARVKILDFGLARALSDRTHLTQSGAIIGTPAYMAPEQAAGRDVDHRCDLFSLGCVLYRLCTGEMAFKGKDTIAIITALALESPKPPHALNPEVPPALSDLVMQLLAKNPHDRHESAQVLAEALQEIEDQCGAATAKPATKTRLRKSSNTAPPAGTHTQLAPPARKRFPRKWLIGGSVLGLGVIALLAFLLSRSRDDAATRDAKPGEASAAGQQAEALPPTFTNSVGMEFVLVPKGKSWLGGGGGKPGDKEVEIKEDFYLGKYEVTQEEWGKVMGSRPSYFCHSGGGKDSVKGIGDEELKRFPVETVSWDDAQLLLTELNKRGKEVAWLYRLPKETEWEYACRGGPMADRLESASDFYFEKPSDVLQPDQANFASGTGKGLQRTCKVGSYKPNRLGLFDMHGNVVEWCDDLLDPKDPARASHRVSRGGWFVRLAWECHAATRDGDAPGSRYSGRGLRLARVPVGKDAVAPPPAAPQKKAEAPGTAYTNSLGMEFMLVPKGKSWLGGGGGKPGDKEVEIKEDFYLGKYEVTQEEWEKLTGQNPAGFKAVPGVAMEDQKRFPVENISWPDCQAFIALVNNQAKDRGWIYRLPTEVEWEYACRGGPLSDRTESAYDFYLAEPTIQLLPAQANFEYVGGLKRTCKVGSYQPNGLGLFDMHGNVWEWCDDDTKRKDLDPDPRRYYRGGGWTFGDANQCRAGHSDGINAKFRRDNLGLRLARIPFGKEIVAAFPAPRPKEKTETARPTFKNSLGTEFVLVPKGKSWLGGGGGKPGDKEVEIKEDFYLGKYEVTQEEWEKLTGQNPAGFKAVPGVSREDQKRFPVENVTWGDCQTFIALVNDRAKEPGWIYRLPKEVEWEYACRGGPLSDRNDSAYDFYLAEPTNYLPPELANFQHAAGLNRTCKVGSYKPNRLGLYDMHGNVWEWCDDDTKRKDLDADARMYRGGGWRFGEARQCSASHSDGKSANFRGPNLGLRLARVPVGKDVVAPPLAPEKKTETPPTFKNSLGMEFVLVPKGKSWLGGGNGKPGNKEVEIMEDFYLGKYEVTQEEWEKVTGTNPSHFSRTGNGKDAVKEIPNAELKRFPVERVSWDDAQLFLTQLNTRDKQEGWVYRLPKEMEWEYACRGGPMSDRLDSAFDYYFDKPVAQLQPEQANFVHDKCLRRTCKVGSYPSNRLGLYDMHGNVWEWCEDQKADKGASLRVYLSGGWDCEWVGDCRAANRAARASSLQWPSLGLCLARVPVGK